MTTLERFNHRFPTLADKIRHFMTKEFSAEDGGGYWYTFTTDVELMLNNVSFVDMAINNDESDIKNELLNYDYERALNCWNLVQMARKNGKPLFEF